MPGKVSEVPKIAGGVVVAVHEDGQCFINGFGNLDTESANTVAKNLVVLASQIRNKARESDGQRMIH